MEAIARAHAKRSDPLPSSHAALTVNSGHSTYLIIRKLIADRQERDRQFGAGLFADPAWDMLLDLYGAEMAGQRVSISSLSAASAVPPTTAQRWITVLDQAGFALARPKAAVPHSTTSSRSRQRSTQTAANGRDWVESGRVGYGFKSSGASIRDGGSLMSRSLGAGLAWLGDGGAGGSRQSLPHR